MRINVYAEELTDETALVTKEVTGENGEKRLFYGIRFYLKSPHDLYATPEDDDRSGITLWAPWTKKEGYDFGAIQSILTGLYDEMERAIQHAINNGQAVR